MFTLPGLSMRACLSYDIRSTKGPKAASLHEQPALPGVSPDALLYHQGTCVVMLYVLRVVCMYVSVSVVYVFVVVCATDF